MNSWNSWATEAGVETAGILLSSSASSPVRSTAVSACSLGLGVGAVGFGAGVSSVFSSPMGPWGVVSAAGAAGC